MREQDMLVYLPPGTEVFLGPGRSAPKALVTGVHIGVGLSHVDVAHVLVHLTGFHAGFSGVYGEKDIWGYADLENKIRRVNLAALRRELMKTRR